MNAAENTLLFRGLEVPFDPSRIRSPERIGGTDFTDCPFQAPQCANARRGVVLVLIAPAKASISEELWLGAKARRLMFCGDFAPYVIAAIPAKDLRAQVRRKGIASVSDQEKAWVLRDYIQSILPQIRVRARSQ
jgi:hypothetical protein